MGILDLFRLDGQVAVITGAGRGIGAASAVALAQAGADVAISARTRDQLDAVAKQVAACGREALVLPADLSEPEAPARLVEQTIAHFGKLSVILNNVGGAMPRPFLNTKRRHIESALAFNVGIAHEVTHAGVPHMLAGGGGAVVNISSTVGRVAGRGYLAYGTAKGALAHYTRLAAQDLAPRIRVNAIAVGSVATSALDIVMTSDELRTQMEAATPMRRVGQTQDIAAAVLYLTSPASAYVTGQLLSVDGGLQAPNLDLGLPDLSSGD
jgi:7-alpha-hydroxysteroid dehydrogenase